MGSSVRAVFISIFLVLLGGTATAQSPNDIINLFGGLVRSGVAAAAQSAWQKVPSAEVACVDQQLRQRGSSINSVVQQGIGPSDTRVFDVRSSCRGQSQLQTARSGPSFECSKSTFPDEFAICSNPELSQLDVQVASAYVYVRDHNGEQLARAIRDRSLRARHACGSDFACIKQVQIASISDYQKLGAPTDWRPIVPSIHPEYIVDGLSLGNRVVFDSAAYRDYQCRPSDQFAGFIFCQKKRLMQEARGSFTSSNTILHSGDGTAVYINRFLEPAFFDGDEAKTDVDGRSKKFGSPSRVIAMPTNSEVRNGMIVSWGDVILEPIDTATINALAAGNGARVGFMIDHIGNLRRSANLGLPIYRMRGGAGYVWAASWNDSGIGTLQFLTIDPSRFMPTASEQSGGDNVGTPVQPSVSVAPAASTIPDSVPSAPGIPPPLADQATPVSAQQARQKIREHLNRITNQRDSLPNETYKAKLDLIASQLATANEQTNADDLKRLLGECDDEDALFREAGEFRQVSDVAKRADAVVKSRLEAVNFEAPLVHDIRAALTSVENALAEGDLKSLKQALSALNEIYDATKLNKLAEAKAHGFDSAESYEEFKDRQSKLGRSGIRLNEK
jgi:hypothetical protein